MIGRAGRAPGETGQGLPAALAEWARTVGPPHVTVVRHALDAAAAATFPTHGVHAAIVRPASTAEVRACLATATRHGLAVQVASRGLNWGYGSRAPTGDGCVLLDLSRMTRIDDYDPELGTVRVEAGVTQGALAAFLALRGGRHWIDPTASHPLASIVGNALERGFGHTPYADHAAHIVSLEVVLPGGEVLHTGAERYHHNAAAACGRHAWGPSLQGLFVQSTFGVVTRMRLELMPAPESMLLCHWRLDDARRLPALVDVLRELRLEGTLMAAVHVANRPRALAFLAAPVTPGGVPVSARGLGAWNATTGLYGPRAAVAAARRRLASRLRGLASGLVMLEPAALARRQHLGALAGRLGASGAARRAELAGAVLGLLCGRPSPRLVPGIYTPAGRMPGEPPDPDGDGIGLIWVSPVIPATGRHAAALAGIVERTLPAFGFEPAVTLTLMRPRTLHAVIGIHYDRCQPGADDRALASHDALLARLLAAGYHPYRVALPSTGRLPAPDDDHQRVLERIGAALDPDRVMAAGRYRPTT